MTVKDLRSPCSATAALVAVALGLICNAARADVARDFDSCKAHPRDRRVRLLTDLGSIDIDLYGVRAPISVCNFLRYVEAGLFTGGRFYRTVRPGNQATAPVKISVIQADIRKDAVTFPPIPLESTVKTGLRHLDGTISMARDAPDTASSSFFITIGNQPTLDFRGARNPDGQGFAAFGRVIRGMAVVRRIWMSPAIGEDLTPPRAIKRAYVVEGQ